MSDFDAWRERSSAGEWSREDAGTAGITCPVCGRDSGYVHACVHCGKPDPGDHDDEEIDLAPARPKPHRCLRLALGKRNDAAALAQHVRGWRSRDEAQRWVDAADDLSPAMTDPAWAVLIQGWLQQRDQPAAWTDPDALRDLVGAEHARAEPRRDLVAQLVERVRTLEDQDTDTPTPDAGGHQAVATDGGTEGQP